MKKTTSNGEFRSAEFWKASLMTLPDSAFFDLLRLVFGKIKTPFSKQALMGDLEKFLQRNDVQKNIAAYINHDDRRIIAALAILNEPSPGDLETFFSGEMNLAELHEQLVNLEERFIVYRFIEEEKSHLALNPVLKQVLPALSADSSLLFPSLAADAVPQAGKYQFDDRVLAALYSFVLHNELFFRFGGGIRQKIAKASQTVFPNLPLETVAGGLKVLGLFNSEGEKLIPDLLRFTAFGNLDRQERMEYCAAGIFCYWDSVPSKEGSAEETPPWLMRSKVRGCAAFIHRLLGALEHSRLYNLATLHKLSFILKSEDTDYFCDRLVSAMEQTGLLIPGAQDCWQKPPAAPASGGKAAIAPDSPFSVLLYPEIEYTDALDLAAVSRVIEAGLNVRFELNRDSAVIAFNRGITAEATIELLQRLSHNRIDDNLVFSLRDWEKSHREVTLRKGLILTLAPDRRYLAETRSLASLITETIAPGIYLLPESAEERVSRALQKAGVAIVARREEPAAGNEYSMSYHTYFPGLEAPAAEKIRHSPPEKKDAGGNYTAITEHFHAILNKMSLSGEERNELAARIDRRLVLCESQLKDAMVRYEKLEARGLDYAGKALIIKQAIAMHAQVEIVCPGKQKPERIFGIPKALEKAGSESIVIVEPRQGDTVRISLGKISLLRRIKKSIFESISN